MIAAFAAKQIDGFAMSLPWTLRAGRRAGTAVMVASGPDGDTIGLDPFTNTVVAAKPATCEKKPALCEAVGQTFVETSAWMHAHPDEAQALLKKRFPTLDDKVFAASFRDRAQDDARTRRSRPPRASRTPTTTTSRPD